MDDHVAVGRITRAHGVRGEVSVLVLSEIGDRFEPGSRLLLEDGRELSVSASRRHHGKMLVRFDEVADRTEAEGLTGMYLVVPAAEVPPAPEGAFWPHELEGSEVMTEQGRSLGRITEVIPAPANDVWVAVDGEEETLIPALRDVVVAVDTNAKRVVIREVPGLTAPDG